MTQDLKSQLHMAFIDAGALILGAVAGGILGYLVLGDHWVGRWVFPIAGAWIIHSVARRYTRRGAAGAPERPPDA